jgi:hypothetical protein
MKIEVTIELDFPMADNTALTMKGAQKLVEDALKKAPAEVRRVRVVKPKKGTAA